MKKVLYILGLLDDRDIDWMVAAGERRVLQKGGVLVREGEALEFISIIASGKVTVSVRGKTVAEIGIGEVIGEISLLDSRPPSATVTADEECVVLAIPIDDLKARLASDQGFAARLYHALGVFLAQRLRRNNLQLTIGTSREIDEIQEEMDEIDPEVLEQLTLAGNRFRIITDHLRVGNARS